MKKFLTFLLAFVIIQFGVPTVSALENTDLLTEFAPQYKIVENYVGGYAVAIDQTNKLIDRYNNVRVTTESQIVLYDECLFSCNVEDASALYDTYGREIVRYNNENIMGANNYLVVTLNEDDEYVLHNYRTSTEWELGKCDSVWLLDEAKVLLQNKGAWSIFDSLSQQYTSLDVDNVIAVHGDVLTVVSEGLYGIMNGNADMIVEPKYKGIVYVSEQYLAFYDNGNDILSAKGDILFSSPDYMTSVCIDGWTVIYGDTIVLKNIYTNEARTIDGFESVSAPYEGYMCGQNEFGLYTYVTMDGKQATDLAWDMVYQFSNGLALVYDVLEGSNNVYYKQWYIINTNFEVVKVLNYDVYIDPYLDSSTDFSDGYIRTIDNETGLMGFIYLENYSASSNNQLKLSPTSLYQIDRERQTLFEVFKDTTVKDFKNQFLNDTEMLSVIDADGNALSDDAYVVDGCKVQLISKSNGTTILDELTIKVSEKVTETDPPTTDPDNPIDSDNPGTGPNKPDNDSDVTDFIDSIADKIGVTSDQLLMIAGGSLAALVLLIIVIAAIKRKCR